MGVIGSRKWEMAELMDDIFREEFLKHPDSKKIIEEYKKTVS